MADQTNQSGGAKDPIALALMAVPIDKLKTKSGKTVADFTVPESLKTDDPELIDLIMRSEAMDDGERQYWFNLTDVMNAEQTQKLRGILSRERRKLAEIHVKYGKKPPVDPSIAAEQARQKAQERMAQQQALQAKEAADSSGEAEIDAGAWG